MNAALQKELEQLLTKYPELQNTKLAFSDTAIKGFKKIENGVITNEEKIPSDVPLCKVKESGPATMFGLSSKVEVKFSPIHGYGIFAKEVLDAGEMIEECKLLRLDNRSKYNTDLVLKDYVWANQQCNCLECREYGHVVYMPLGFASQYNHSDTPNTQQQLNFKTEVFTLKAKQRIEKDEEIFVTYGDKYFLIRNFWKNLNKTKAFEKAIRNKNIMDSEKSEKI